MTRPGRRERDVRRRERLPWGRIVPRYLPPYLPTLNPSERLWQNPKTDCFFAFPVHSPEDPTDRLAFGLRHYREHPDARQSIP